MHEHRGPAIAIALAIVAFFTTMAFVVVVVGWIAFSIYALVKAIGSAPDDGNPIVVALMFVGVATGVVVLLTVAVGMIGRSMVPSRFRLRRKDPDADRDLLFEP